MVAPEQEKSLVAQNGTSTSSFRGSKAFAGSPGFRSSLDTATGWDDVTGVGSPVAPQFVAALK